MVPLRRREAAICRELLDRNLHRRLEDLAWDQMAPVGREFGSLDFDQLMEEDFRNRAGVFDSKLKGLLRRVQCP